MKYIIVILFMSLVSCNNTSNLTPKQLRIGTFETFLEENTVTSIAHRNDSIQVEVYNKKKDTFHIRWKSNFEYILRKKNPKTDLDKTDFVVKITGVHKNSYTFRAYYKGSNFKQTGKAIKIK